MLRIRKKKKALSNKNFISIQLVVLLKTTKLFG